MPYYFSPRTAHTNTIGEHINLQACVLASAMLGANYLTVSEIPLDVREKFVDSARVLVTQPLPTAHHHRAAA